MKPTPPLAISYIRFSTLEQKKGDSFRRQYQKTIEYCEQNDLDLSSERYLDEGLSAYLGTNKEKGRLGDLLNAIKDRKIPRGSYLIIESLDRLSRQDIGSQLRLFLEILEHGINIVTLMDGAVHSAEKLKDAPNEIMFALGTMIRANQESEIKSKRVGEAWANKRRTAAERPLTRIAPAWLKLEKGKFVLIEDRGAVVREIFEGCLAGLGRRATAKKLNARGEPVWGSKAKNKSGLWNDSYIAKILANRAVLGEYQPHTKKGGKRFVSGPPLVGYYPTVISEQIFYACQGKAERRTNRGGREISKAKNLFNAVARCAVCGGRMEFQDKGNGEKYLKCRASSFKSITCTANGVNYPIVEDFMVSVLMSGRWVELLDNKESGKDDALALEAAEAKLLSINRKIGNLLDLAESGGEISDISERLNRNREERAQLERAIAGLKAKTAETKSRMSTYKEAVHAKYFISSSDARNEEWQLALRRTIKMMMEDTANAVYLECLETGAVGFFVVLKSGNFVIGTQKDFKSIHSRFEVVVAKWHLRTDEARIAIQYSFEEDREEILRPKPSLYEISKGVDLVEKCLSLKAVKTIRMLGFVPTEKPDFRKLNKEQRRILRNQLEDFASLAPDYTIDDHKGEVMAGYFWKRGLKPLREVKSNVEQNFQSRLKR